MATRFRLPSVGTAPVSPAVQSYAHTGTTRYPLPLTDSSALTTVALAPDAADHIAAGDTFFAQFVSAPLGPQVIASGLTVKLVLQALEANLNNELKLQLWLGLYDNTGAVLLATLLAKTADALELNTTIQNRLHQTTTTAGYTCVGGERLVAEVSVVGTPVATGGVQGHNASLRLGANGVGGDNGENDTDTGATLNPWLELSQDLNFTLSLTSSLASYWKLDEASGNRADSHGANTMAPINAPGNTAGKFVNALLVDRALWKFTSYSGSGLDLSTTESWSWQAWVNPVDRSGYFTILNDNGESPRKIYFFLEQTSGQFYRWDTFASGLIVPTGVWSHIVYTFQSTGVNTGIETAYVNNVSATRTGAVPAPGTGVLNIGSATNVGSQIFSGGIDEVAYWRRALSAAEVSQLHNSGAGLPYPFTAPAQSQAPRSMHQFRMRRAA